MPPAPRRPWSSWRGCGAGPSPIETAWQLVEATASALGLPARAPWHTTRAPLTTVADALVTCTDAYGHLAADVATLSRPEIGELAEGSGGGSSTMPHKRNPALSVLIRRAALAGPGLAATVHLAAATTVDERPDGAWHAEWAALRDLGRRTVVAASQTSDLLADLRVDTERMAANLDRAEGVRAEQQSMAALVGAEPSATYLGATPRWIEAALRRAETYLTAAGQDHRGDDVSIPTITGVQLSDPGAGPLLVLGPSLGTSATTLWSPTAALLAERFHVIGWDLPGHGRTTAVGDGFTMGELAAGVLTLVEAVLAERGEPGGTFGYAGDSVGGAVGLQLLLDHPDRVTGAVLLCTGAKIGEPDGWHERAATVPGLGHPGDGHRLGRALVRRRLPGRPRRRGHPAAAAICSTPTGRATRRSARPWPTSTSATDWPRSRHRCWPWPAPRTSPPHPSCWPRSPPASGTGDSSCWTVSRTWPRPRRRTRSPA